MFALGAVDPLYVDKFGGFDRPRFVSLVSVLSDGTPGPFQVMQSGSLPMRTASVTGEILDAGDVAVLRGYDDAKSEVIFRDGNGNLTLVRVLELSIADETYRWTFAATLVATGDAVETVGVGAVRAGLSTTLAADPAVGATNLKVASVTTVAAGDFVRVGAASVTATELNSEILRVLTVGTTGSGGTGLGVESDTGAGAVLDHASGAEVKTIAGTLLAGPARAGAVNVLVDSVSGLVVDDAVRIGYLDHYETRVLTAVGTAGPTGTGISFARALERDHSLDEWVVEVET